MNPTDPALFKRFGRLIHVIRLREHHAPPPIPLGPDVDKPRVHRDRLAAFDHFGRGRFEHWDEGYAILAFGIAVYFFPIISATALPGEQAFLHWMWFSSWP